MNVRELSPPYPLPLGRRAALALLLTLGLVLASAILFDVHQDWMLEGKSLGLTLAENVIPLLLALGIPVMGWRIAQKQRGTAYVSEGARWSFAGAVGTLLVAWIVVGFQLLQSEIKPGVIIVHLTTIGAGAGLFMGYTISQAKDAREELRRERNLLEQTQRLAGGWEIDLRTSEMSWSDEVYRIHEVEPGTEISIEEGIEFYAPEVRPRVRAAFERCAEQGERYDLEVPLITANGTRRWVRTVGAPVETDDGDIVKVVGAVQDITERKQSQRWSAKVIERVTDAIVEVDSDWRFTLLNDQAEALYDVEESDLLGKNFWEVFADARGTRFEEEYRAVMETRQPTSFEEYYPGLDGWFGIQVFPKENGGIAFYFRDITEQKKREQTLREERDRYVTLFESLPTPVVRYTFQEDGAIVCDANEAFESVFGVEDDAVEGKNLDELIVPEDEREEASRINRRVMEEGSYTAEVQRRTHDGVRDFQLHVAGRKSENAPVEAYAIYSDVTERKRREQRLEEMHERTEHALEHTDSMIFEVDLNTGTVRRDAGFEHFFDFPTEEISTWEDYLDRAVHPDDRDEFCQFYRELIEGEREDGTIEYRTPPESGSLRWIQDSVHVEENGARRAIGLAQDITERKERARRLEERDRKLEQIRKNVTDVVWMSPADKSEIEFVSKAFEDIWGRPTERLKENPNSVVEAIHPDDRERVRAALELQKENPEAYAETYRVVQPDGEVRWVRDRAAGVYREDGMLERIIGVATDITERKRAERELRDTKRLLEKTFESLSDAVFVVDPTERRIVMCNEAVENTFGYEKETLTGRSTEILHKSQKAYERFGQTSEAALKEKGVFQGEHQMRRKDGTIIETEHVVTPLEGDDWTQGVVSVVRDITEQKRREERLREAKEEAERANRLKSAFLANMSHEIRTPLTSILGFAEAIGEEISDLEKRHDGSTHDTIGQFARLIAKSGRRLMKTLDAVLNLSKLEAGEMHLSTERVNLSAEVQATAEEIQSRAEEAGVDLEVQSEDPVWAEADKGGVQIVLRNLANNAIKYTREGGHVRLQTFTEEGGAVLKVEDTGIGMVPEKVPELFEPFRQASEGIGREYEGTGLGLAVTKKTTHEMDGSLEVETEKGEGTCFTVWLPKAEEA